jgi:hypothetical protein
MKAMENVMKKYETPVVALLLFDLDVITASDSNDNNFDDIEDWE